MTYIRNMTVLHLQLYLYEKRCVKSVRIWSYSGPYFATFGFYTDQSNSESVDVLRSDI